MPSQQDMLRAQARVFAKSGANGLAYMMNVSADLIDNLQDGNYQAIEAKALGDAGNYFDSQHRMINSREAAEILYKMAQDRI